MPSDPDHHDEATATLLAELRDLCTDVTSDATVRARRLRVLRRLERCAGERRRAGSLATA